MKRLIFFTLFMCTMVLSLTSCGSKNNELIGKWEQVVEQAGVKAVLTYDFKDNGTLTQTMVMKSESPMIDIDGEATCVYSYSGNTITFKFSNSDITFNKYKIEGLDDAMVKVAMEEMKSEMVGMEQKLTDVKIEGDKLTARFNGQKLELNRI